MQSQSDLYALDQLWVGAICANQFLKKESDTGGPRQDEFLEEIICLSLFDDKAKEPERSKDLQKSMRYTATLTALLWERSYHLEGKVGSFVLRHWCHKSNSFPLDTGPQQQVRLACHRAGKVTGKDDGRVGGSPEGLDCNTGEHEQGC